MFRYLVFTLALTFSFSIFAENLDIVPTRGNLNSEIQVTMFLDYQCPYSRRGNETINDLQKENNFSFSVRHFPLSFHKYARVASKVAICAGEQNKYFEMHDKIYSIKTEDLNSEDILRLVKVLNLNVEAHKKCMESDMPEKIIERDLLEAKTYEVTGTPTFVITGPKGNKIMVGAYPKDEILKVINSLR